MKDTLITVPMKDPRAAKTRLGNTLGAAGRQRLARLLYRRTLDFLGPIGRDTGADLAVVTGSAEAAELARKAGFHVIQEVVETNLSAAANCAAAWAEAEGYRRLCLIPADLAAPDPSDVKHLLTHQADVAICPSVDRGTNALLVSLPTAIRFRYGPQSAVRHLEEAQANGLIAAMIPLESLSFDIDTSACLDRARRNVPDLSDLAATA
ncbi:MAG: 2-phospho-L-lactate guanylyltransferase [Pseudomonadota bacterium]